MKVNAPARSLERVSLSASLADATASLSPVEVERIVNAGPSLRGMRPSLIGTGAHSDDGPGTATRVTRPPLTSTSRASLPYSMYLPRPVGFRKKASAPAFVAVLAA